MTGTATSANSIRSLRAATAFALLFVLLTASPSWADGDAMAAKTPPTTRSMPSARTADEGWRYNTEYLYPLTRQMDESDIPNDWRRYALYPITLVLDTVQLPAGAVMGLFGD